MESLDVGAVTVSTISAEGCAAPGKNAISPAFRALDTHDLRRGLRWTGQKRNAFRALDTYDLRRGLRRTGQKRNLTCISRPRRARSPQRVAFRGAPAAPPPALREEEREVKM